MGSHPVNLAFRFLLELAALAIFGFWGWEIGEGFARFIFAFGIPVFAAVIWGVFAVPGDPSRSGKAPVPVHGIIRLFIELAIFAVAIWMLFNLGLTLWARLFGAAVVTHYLLSMDRILWLIGKQAKDE
jgi:hypothetical protein